MTAATSRYRQVFRGRHAVLPVIHVDTLDQALRNTRIARDSGAAGAFPITHAMPDEALLDVPAAVAAAQAGWWVGVNCLGMAPGRVFGVVSGAVGGVWADNAGIEEASEEQPYAGGARAARDARAPGCLYSGGVAFKYQRPVEDLAAASRVAARYMAVAPTSGPGTGHAAGAEKIRRMKRALGDALMGIASGVTPENAGDDLPQRGLLPRRDRDRPQLHRTGPGPGGRAGPPGCRGRGVTGTCRAARGGRRLSGPGCGGDSAPGCRAIAPGDSGAPRAAGRGAGKPEGT